VEVVLDVKPGNTRRKSLTPDWAPDAGNEMWTGNLDADDMLEAGRGAGGLQDEIAMLRAIIRRVFEQAGRIPDEEDPRKELQVWSRVLATLGTAATRLAGLLRTQKALAGGANDFALALSHALNEVREELEK
jgi:hypothetical protein